MVRDTMAVRLFGILFVLFIATNLFAQSTPTTHFAFNKPTPSTTIRPLNDPNNWSNLTNLNWDSVDAMLWQIITGGSIYARGIDCSGAIDSTTAFQNAIDNTPDYGTLKTPGVCSILISSTINVHTRRGIAIEPDGSGRPVDSGAVIKWIGSAGGTMFDFNSSDHTAFRGFYLDANCLANVAINSDNTVGGATNTNKTFLDLVIHYCVANGTPNPNFVGIQVSKVSGNNSENFTIQDIQIFCSNSYANRTGVGIDIGPSANAKNEHLIGIGPSYCGKGIWQQNGNILLSNLNGGYNDYDVYIDGGTDNNVYDNINTEASAHGMHASSIGGTIQLRNSRLSNQAEGTSGGYIEIGSGIGLFVFENNTVGYRPPPGGHFFDTTSATSLYLVSRNNIYAAGSQDVNGVIGLGITSDQVGFSAISQYLCWESVNDIGLNFGRGNIVISGCEYGVGGPVSTGGSRRIYATNYNPDLFSAGINLEAGSKDSVSLGDGEVEISGVPRPNGLAMATVGTAGSTNYNLFVLAKDSSGRRSMRTDAIGTNHANATLSGSNYVHFSWNGSPGTSVQYEVYMLEPGNGSKACLLSGSVSNTYYDLQANPTCTDVQASLISSLTPSRPESTQVIYHAPFLPVSLTYAQMNTLAGAVNSMQVFCTDCNATCTAGASTGRTCFRENGVWTH